MIKFRRLGYIWWARKGPLGDSRIQLYSVSQAVNICESILPFFMELGSSRQLMRSKFTLERIEYALVPGPLGFHEPTCHVINAYYGHHGNPVKE